MPAPTLLFDYRKPEPTRPTHRTRQRHRAASHLDSPQDNDGAGPPALATASYLTLEERVEDAYDVFMLKLRAFQISHHKTMGSMATPKKSARTNTGVTEDVTRHMRMSLGTCVLKSFSACALAWSPLSTWVL